MEVTIMFKINPNANSAYEECEILQELVEDGEGLGEVHDAVLLACDEEWGWVHDDEELEGDLSGEEALDLCLYREDYDP